jgi:hypothetical protein
MLIRESINSLEIYKLEPGSTQPHMQSICLLELPPLKPDALIVCSMFSKEWIASSERHARSQFSQRRLLPFRSFRNDTMALLISYHITRTSDIPPAGYAMLFSVTALLSVVRSGVRKMSWKNWGPLRTRILPSNYPRSIMPTPAGPFWITSVSPLIVCDYDPLRAVYAQSAAEDPSSPSGLPVFAPTKVVGEHWVLGQVETCLPYREFVSRDIHILHPSEILGEREWIIVISATVR